MGVSAAVTTTVYDAFKGKSPGTTASDTLKTSLPVFGAYESNQEAHAKTNTNTQIANNQAAANNAIALSNNQQQDKLNAQAMTTAVAQARVRAISNPDASSIMTSPLGVVGGKSPMQSDVAQRLYGGSTPTINQAPSGKSTVGG